MRLTVLPVRQVQAPLARLLVRQPALISDTRQACRVPTSAVVLSVFGMHALRLGSVNELEAQLRIPSRWEPWVGPRKPSADTLG